MKQESDFDDYTCEANANVLHHDAHIDTANISEHFIELGDMNIKQEANTSESMADIGKCDLVFLVC